MAVNKLRIVALALACLALESLHPARAALPAPDFLDVGGVSYHYDANGRRFGYNESNPGLGVTWAGRSVGGVEADLSVGYYENSIGRPAFYAAAHVLPWRVAGGRAGVTVALATGYLVPVLPMVAPTVCWERVCVLATPPVAGEVGMVSAQFRVRF